MESCNGSYTSFLLKNVLCKWTCLKALVAIWCFLLLVLQLPTNTSGVATPTVATVATPSVAIPGSTCSALRSLLVGQPATIESWGLLVLVPTVFGLFQLTIGKRVIRVL